MKYLVKTGILILLILLCIPDDAAAQRSRKKKKKKKETTEKVEFARQLWYGGGFGLSFFSQGLGGGLDGNNFAVGLSPMAGYKILPWLSVGPRLEVEYITGRYRFFGAGQVYKLNAFSYAAGPFLRAKTPINIFGHFEYQFRNEVFLTGEITIDNKLKTVRQSRDAFYLGAGYHAGSPGGWGYEMGLYYDVLAPDNSTDIPIQYRFGITYNF